jgi:hypothetical protein
MAYQNTDIFLGDRFIPKLYLGENEIDVTPYTTIQDVYKIRPDKYSDYIAYAQPMNYFSVSFGMTNYMSDIHAAIKGSGTNYYFPISGSGQVIANGSKTNFAADGYATSMQISGSQNAGAWGPTTVPSDLDMGSADFVWEAYVNTDAPIGLASNVGIELMSGYGDTGNWTFNQAAPNAYIRYLVGPGDHYSDSAYGLPSSANVWRHWAFVKSGANYYCYWNGTRVISFGGGPYTMGVNNPVRLLGGGPGYDQTQTAQYQDFRIYKGTDKGYTGATITPPPSIVTYNT